MDGWLTLIVDLQRMIWKRIGCQVPLDDLIGMSPDDLVRLKQWLDKQVPPEDAD